MSYSEDLRKKAMGYLDAGHSQRDAARVFGVHLSTVNKWKQMREKTGSLKDKTRKARRFSKIDPMKLSAYVEAHPDAYLSEMATAFGCCPTAIQKALTRLGITRKKRRNDSGNKTKPW